MSTESRRRRLLSGRPDRTSASKTRSPPPSRRSSCKWVWWRDAPRRSRRAIDWLARWTLL